MFSKEDFLTEVAAFPVHPKIREVATALHFDEQYEFLWAGTKSGGLYVYECPSLSSYSWFRGHNQKVQAVKNVRGGAVSISSKSIRVHAHGGRPKLTHDDIEGNLASMALDPSDGGVRGSKLIVGRTTGVISVFDLRTSQYLNRASVADSSVGCMETVVSGLVACGMSSGRILLVDPRSGLKVKHQVLGHRGGIVDIASKHNLLVSCGYDMHAGSLVVDTFIKVYDARSLRESLSSVSFPAGPSYLEFHPKFSSTLVIASTADMIGLQEIQADSIPMAFQVNTDNSGLLSFAVSSSGDLFALGGGRGMLRLEASSRHATVNLMSAPHMRPRSNPCLSVSLPEDGPFHLVPQHTSITGRLLSDWDPATIIDVGRPPRIVDEATTRNLFQAHYMGHGPVPESSDVGERGAAACQMWALKNMRVEREAEPAVVTSHTESQCVSPMTVDSASQLPEMYYPVEIKRSVAKRFEEFDFGFYNDTGRFSGLENGIPNSYCNGLLQVLFFHPALRKALLERQPDPSQEISLLDEMTFLFRMLADGPAAPCQASNLLRALHHVQEAGALGLLDGSSERKALSLSEKISSLYKFIMEKLHREWKNSSGTADSSLTPMESIFGIKFLIHTKCLNGEKAERTQSMTSFMVEFPCLEELEEPPASLRFCDLLQSSLQSDVVLQAWFDENRGDQHVRQTRVPVDVGEVLVVSCGSLETFDLTPPLYQGMSVSGQQIMQIPSMLGIRQGGGRGELVLSQGDTLDALGFSQEELHAIEEGRECCDFAVFELTGMVASVRDENSSAGRGSLIAHVKLQPQYLHRHQGVQRLVEDIPSPTKAPFGDSRVSDARQGANALDPMGCQTYADEIVSGRTGTTTDSFGEGMGAVDSSRAAMNVGPQDSGASGECSLLDSPKSSCGSGPVASSSSSSRQWLLVNDFHLMFTSQEEVQNLYGGRKSPCLLFFTKRNTEQTGKSAPSVHTAPVLDHWEFCELCRSRPLQGLNARMNLAAFKPLEFTTEMPKPGSLFALDAEFVVQGPTSGVGLSGFKKDNTRMILGRVSVVRGEGPMAGVCCIDDYVRPLETVQDYLTRFSGLVEGDLDANTSQHYLTTLKHVYVKLRYLVDCGCIFVGHGLKMDFRIINIVVPQNQIIDTVELFHLKRHRMFSLRFLASYLLKLDIQSNTHDSIEDARTALQLYEMYNKLVKEGVFEARLKEMYRWGNRHGWDPGFWLVRPGEMDKGLG